MSSTQNNVYRIQNAVFSSYVGLAAEQDPEEQLQPIVGTRFDPAAHTRFIVHHTNDDRVIFHIDGLPVGEVNKSVIYACADRSIEADEWIVEFVSEANFRRLYYIALASQPDLVWTLNSPNEPANNVHLAPLDRSNPRQLWDVAYQPY
ncbi:hypothetical protein AN958_12052 [Leucoagaricus sp. SymC.cos]|nr:hypothetical protein AN958_12052 [Leucoagaricus sp. SymC.cos]